MKGVTLFADVLSVLILLAVIMFSTLLIWGLMMLRNVEMGVGAASPRTVELTIFYLPARYDATMMAFLEYQSQGVPMREALEAAAIQQSNTVWIRGKTIYVDQEADNYFSSVLTKPFILKMALQGKEQVIIDKSIQSSVSMPTSLQKVTTKLFLLNGEVVDLELFVRD